MKRAGWMVAALLLALPVVAQAKVLVVWDVLYDGVGGLSGDHAMQIRMQSAVTDVLDRAGVDYKMIPITKTKTEWLRTGDQVWNYGTPGATVEHFDAVIMKNWPGRRGNNLIGSRDTRFYPPAGGGCYACSLTVISKLPLVPQLWLFGASSTGTANLDYYRDWVGSSGGQYPCSTGVSAPNGNQAVPALDYIPGNPAKTWFSASNQPAMSWSGTPGTSFSRSATSPAGGLRGLVGVSVGNFARQGWSGVPCVNCDSVPFGPTVDSLVVWERQNIIAGHPEYKPIVFANIMGAGPCSDSIALADGTDFLPCEFDAPTLMIGLARIDSASGGKVFKKRAPNVVAITVDGAFEHTTATWGIEGAYLPDSAGVKANLRDSCMAYGIPITLGVDPTKFAAYPAEVAWYRMPTARYSPQVWRGVKDSTAASGACDTTGTGVVDVFGRYRNRMFYTLPSHSAADTSIYCNLVRSRDAVAAVFGRDRLSRTVLAPWDDYSPKNIRSVSGGMDSLIVAVTRAGFTAIRTDVQHPEANPAYGQPNRDLIRGGIANQRKYRSPLGASVNFVGHTGYSTSGGNKFFAYRNDSTTIPMKSAFGIGLSYPTITHANLGRFWGGFFHETWRDVDWFPRASAGDGTDGGYLGDGWANVLFPLNDNLYDQHRGSVLKMHVSDFTGKRPGWWTVKSLKREIDYINQLAGRTVIRLGYPEEIVP